jgi:hypothetical protein
MNARDSLADHDKDVFMYGRENWENNFPKTIGEYIPGNELFPKIYDEVTKQLKLLSDFDCAQFQKNAFEPLGLDNSNREFSLIGIIMNDLCYLKCDIFNMQRRLLIYDINKTATDYRDTLS